MYLKKNCVIGYTTCYCGVMVIIILVLPLMKTIFIFFSKLKWEYIRIMEVQEVTMEVQEESVPIVTWSMSSEDA